MELAVKYPNGDEVRLGDMVRLDGSEGVVVASIDTDEYSSEHPKADWEYLKRGVMIEFKTYGLIHYDQAEPDLELIRRAAPSAT